MKAPTADSPSAARCDDRIPPIIPGSADGDAERVEAHGEDGPELKTPKPHPHYRVLWIDDEIAPQDPAVRFLNLDGFDVDCARTGTHGLSMACSEPYDRLILDLGLPDLPGLSVLAKLRAAGVGVPVLVLTGLGDYESALTAGALGAGAFKSKPLFVDELAATLLRLEAPSARARRADHVGKASEQVIGELLVNLGSLTQRSHAVDSRDLTSWEADGSRLQAALFHALAAPELTVPVFLACSEGFRMTVAVPDGCRQSDLAGGIHELIIRALQNSPRFDATVAGAVGDIERAIANGRRPAEAEIAHACNIDPAHLGRLLLARTGFGFRRWRTGLALKAAVALLVESDEQIKQIACRRLGFEHESQFDREFREVFGVTPTQFRRLWHSCHHH